MEQMLNILIGLTLLFAPGPVSEKHVAAPTRRAENVVTTRATEGAHRSALWRGKPPLICAAEGCGHRPATYCLVGKRLRIEAALPNRAGCAPRWNIRDAGVPKNRR